jgi:hypothetical protein
MDELYKQLLQHLSLSYPFLVVWSICLLLDSFIDNNAFYFKDCTDRHERHVLVRVTIPLTIIGPPNFQNEIAVRHPAVKACAKCCIQHFSKVSMHHYQEDGTMWGVFALPNQLLCWHAPKDQERFWLPWATRNT